MMNQTAPITPKEQIKVIKILTATMCAGLGLICAILIYLRSGQPTGDAFAIGPWGPVLLAVFAGTLTVFGSVFFRKKVESTGLMPLDKKLETYRIATIVRYAMMEGPGLIGAILYFLSGDFVYLVIAGALFLLMLISRPDDDSIKMHLGLSDQEMRQLK